MNEWIQVLLSLSFSGTLLLLLVFFLKPFYKNKFSKCWQYYIWLIVAFRFLLPLTPEASLTGYVFHMAQTAEVSNSISRQDMLSGISDTDITMTAAQSDSPYFYLLFVWGTFALSLIIRKITIYQNFTRYLKAGNIEVSDIETLNLLADCEEELNISRTIELNRNPLVASPVIVGFLHPAIIMPVGQMTTKEMAYIFKHELIHYKRRDMLYKWLIQLIVCIHWFNPFVYLLGKEINRACELSCDEAVIHSLDEKGKQSYGDTLLSFVKSSNGYKSQIASITLTEGAEQLKERLGAIMNYKKKSKTATVMASLFTMMLCFFFAITGAYAAPSDKSDYANQTIEKNSGFTYVQRGYYYDSFIIEMGWNLSNGAANEYYRSEISLKDLSKMTAYFDASVKEYTKDEKAMAALAGLIFSLKNDPVQTPRIESPLIISITPIQSDNMETLAQEYFESGNLTGFSAIFPVLNTAAQKEYLEEIYEDNNIAFFASVINGMDNDLILLYADQSEQDKKVNFFSVILPYLQTEHINRYAEQYYESNDIARFSIMVPYMSDEVKRDWFVKANNDRNNTFCAVISKELSD